jgi:uncharacterized protein YkwD
VDRYLSIMTMRTPAVRHHSTGTFPIRRGLAFLLSALILLVPLQAQRAGAITDEEATFAAMVNDVRFGTGVRTLRVTDRLSKVARRHSRQMAVRGELYHSDLRRAFRGFTYRMVGENVGFGGSLDELLEAFLDSPPHRQNLVANWKKTGVGVYWNGGRVWITQVFLT